MEDRRRAWLSITLLRSGSLRRDGHVCLLTMRVRAYPSGEPRLRARELREHKTRAVRGARRGPPSTSRVEPHLVAGADADARAPLACTVIAATCAKMRQRCRGRSRRARAGQSPSCICFHGGRRRRVTQKKAKGSASADDVPPSSLPPPPSQWEQSAATLRRVAWPRRRGPSEEDGAGGQHQHVRGDGDQAEGGGGHIACIREESEVAPPRPGRREDAGGGPAQGPRGSRLVPQLGVRGEHAAQRSTTAPCSGLDCASSHGSVIDGAAASTPHPAGAGGGCGRAAARGCQAGWRCERTRGACCPVRPSARRKTTPAFQRARVQMANLATALAPAPAPLAQRKVVEEGTLDGDMSHLPAAARWPPRRLRRGRTPRPESRQR